MHNVEMVEGNSCAMVHVAPLSVDRNSTLLEPSMMMSEIFPIEYNEESIETAA